MEQEDDKKSIKNKAAEKEKLCSVEKVREKGKKSAFGEVKGIQKVQ